MYAILSISILKTWFVLIKKYFADSQGSTVCEEGSYGRLCPEEHPISPHHQRGDYQDPYKATCTTPSFWHNNCPCNTGAGRNLYIYIQKSGNYTFSRRSFSMHKRRPLLKPMMIVSTTGYIVSVLGPYLADPKNNDSSILNHSILSNTEEIQRWI